VRDDAEHRGILERVHGDTLEPAPAAIAVPEAVFEAIELGLVCRRGEDVPEALAHLRRIFGVQEVHGVLP
jgi:hypothetical protein